MSIEAMKHYEAALLEAFPRGATGDVFEHWNKARQAIEQAQEPVAWIEHHKAGDNLVWDKPNKGTPLYTTPQPQRQWVGLTDEERKEIAEQCIQPLIFLVKDHAISIEAKLKERNT